MKLLKKSVVQSNIAEQKRQQIDEGIKIAQKIDILRQDLGGLEQQHKNFLQRSYEEIAKLTEEINNLVRQKNLEIKDLEEKRKVLTQPLDEEWAKINTKIIELNFIKNEIDGRLAHVDELESKAQKRYDDSKIVLSRIKTRERELVKSLLTAEESKERTLAFEKEIQNRKDEIEHHFIDKDSELLSREAQLASRERENEIACEKNESDRVEITRIKAQLEDQRKTLEREIARRK